MFNPFKECDFIDAQGNFGRVSEISIVNTKIVTTDNREIMIPNGELLKHGIHFPFPQVDVHVKSDNA